jgi:methionine-rich copper-binding protein CopC
MITVTYRRLALALLLVLMCGTELCWAHALLMDSTPKVNSSIQGPALDINLRFNVRVDGRRSRLRMITADGTSSILSPVIQAAPETLRSRATGLKPGSYKIQWQVLAADGHISSGEISFTVT